MVTFVIAAQFECHDLDQAQLPAVAELVLALLEGHELALTPRAASRPQGTVAVGFDVQAPAAWEAFRQIATAAQSLEAAVGPLELEARPAESLTARQGA